MSTVNALVASGTTSSTGCQLPGGLPEDDAVHAAVDAGERRVLASSAARGGVAPASRRRTTTSEAEVKERGAGEDNLVGPNAVTFHVPEGRAWFEGRAAGPEADRLATPRRRRRPGHV
jgi:hypothetical protein